MPCRHAATFDAIASFANLRAAWLAARRAGRARGGAARFHHALEEELTRLGEELRSGTYRPGPYRSFYVHEPKRRLVSAAPFRDRVVHHAIVRVLEPLFERRFVADSYANRRGKGTHAAVDRAEAYARRHRFCLRGDVVKFFPSIDHEVLLGTVSRVVACRHTLDLLRVILEGGAHVFGDDSPRTLYPGDDLWALLRPRGLPIGNLTSQFLANVHLDPLDHFVKETLRVPGYVRYADDVRLFHDSKERLHEIHREIEHFLAGLRLSLHERKTVLAPCSAGVPFLGFVLFPDGRRRLRREGVRRARKRIRRLVRDVRRGQLSRSRAHASVRSWLAHAAHAHARSLCRQILSEVPFRCPPTPPRSSSARTTSPSGSCPQRRSSPEHDATR